MRVGDAIPEMGTVFDWDIEEILSRRSGDLSGFIEEYYADIDDDVEMSAVEEISDAWDMLLERKREDAWYEDVFESIRENGFVRPLTAHIREGQLALGDGHHRLAAAVELGLSTVPVIVCPQFTVIQDSGGSWNREEPIPPHHEEYFRRTVLGRLY